MLDSPWDFHARFVYCWTCRKGATSFDVIAVAEKKPLCRRPPLAPPRQGSTRRCPRNLQLRTPNVGSTQRRIRRQDVHTCCARFDTAATRRRPDGWHKKIWLLQRWPRKSGTLNSVWGFQHLDHFRTIVYYYFTKVTSRKKYFCNSVIFFGRSNKSPDSVITKGAPLISNRIS